MQLRGPQLPATNRCNFLVEQIMKIKDAFFIGAVSPIETEDGDLIDAIELADGRVLAITGDSIVLYEDMDDLLEGGEDDRPSLAL